VEQSDVFVIALIVLVPAALLWGLFISGHRPKKSAAARLGIPQAMRPGQSDEVLENKRLERIQWGGVVATALTALFIVVYWFPEADRQEAFAERFDEEAVERGELIFAQPPILEEDADAVTFRRLEREIALGQACLRCHGAKGSGGTVPGGYTDPVTGKTVQYQAPPLNNVFTRWDEEVIRFTIERGRPGTPMPAWGVVYGGSMTTQMISDVIAYLKSLPGNQEAPGDLPEGCDDPDPVGGENTLECGKAIFEARCAVCHGPRGQGKDDDELWYQGMALWKGEVTTLTTAQHLTTVIDGRRFAFMPGFGEAPSQGLPIPPYPLSDSQIRAVVEYERSL
jgi:mono/diheme cytochrome c family protein